MSAAAGGDIQRQLQVLLAARDGGLGAAVENLRQQLGDVANQQRASASAQMDLSRAMEHGTRAIVSQVQHLTQLQGALDTAVKTMTGLTGAFGALAVGAARAESKQKAFNQSMQQAGVDGEAFIAKLREQSLGMLSDVDLYTKSTQAMMLIGQEAFKEVGGEAETFSRLMRVAMAAGRATGQDLEYMFQSIVMGIGRASPLILDNLGLSMRLGDVYEKAAAQLGKKADALTMTERKVALLNEVLKQGEPYVTKYGISTGGIKTQLEKLGAQVQNLSYHLGVTFIPIMQPVLKDMAELVQLLDKYAVPAFDQLWKVVAKVPTPLLNAAVAFGALRTVVGPVQGLLETFGGAGGGTLAKLMGRLVQLTPLVIGFYSAWGSNWLGVKDKLAPLVSVLERVRDVLSDITLVMSRGLPDASEDAMLAFKTYNDAFFKRDDDGKRGGREAGVKALLDARREAMLSGKQEQAGTFGSLLSTVGGERAGSAQGWLQNQQLGRQKEAEAGAGPLLGALRRAKDEVPDLMAELQESLEAGAKALLGGEWRRVGEQFGRIADALVAAMRRIVGGSEGLQQILDDLHIDIDVGDVRERLNDAGEAIEAFRDRLGELADVAREHGDDIKGALAGVFAIAGGVAAARQMARLTAATGALGRAMAALRGIAATVARHFGTLRGAVAALWATFQAGGAGGVLASVGAALMSWQVILGLVAAAVIAFAAAYALNFNGVRDKTNETVQAAVAGGEAWRGVLDTVAIAFETGAQSIGRLLTGVAEGIGYVREHLLEWTLTLVDAVVVGFERLVELALAALKGLLLGLPELLGGLIDVFASIFGLLTEVVVALGLGLVRAVIVAVAVAFMDLGPAVIDFVIHGFLPAMAKLLGFLLGRFAHLMDRILITIVTNAARMWEAMTGWARDISQDDVATAFRSIVDSISSWMSSLWTRMKNWGAEMRSAFIEGLEFGAKSGMTEGGGGGGGGSSERSGGGRSWGGGGGGSWASEGSRYGTSAYGSSNATGASDPGAEGGGGGGKGGKEKQAKGEGAKKDPLQEAYQAIQAIAGMIQAGIDAMKKAWEEWRGAAPPEILDEIFEAMRDLAERAVEMAEDIKPELMAAAREWADMVGAVIGTLSSTVDLMNGMARMRQPAETALAEVQLMVENVAEWALAVYERLAPSSLEKAVETFTMAKHLAETTAAWLANLAAMAEATKGLATARLDQNLAGAQTFLEGVLDMAWLVLGHAKGNVGGRELTPRDLLGLKDVSAQLSDWLGILGDLGKTTDSLARSRWPSDLAAPQAFLSAIFDMAVAFVERARTGYGTGLLVALEDMAGVSQALEGWIGNLTGLAAAADGLSQVRWSGDLGQAAEWMGELLDHAGALTARLQAAHQDRLLVVLEDMMAVAQALEAWIKPLAQIGAVASTVQFLTALAERGVKLNTTALFRLVDTLAGGAGEFVARARALLGNDLPLAIEDSEAIAKALGEWMRAFGTVGDTLGSLVSMDYLERFGGGVPTGRVGQAFDLIRAIVTEAGALFADARAVLGDRVGSAMAESHAVASAVTAWLGVAAQVAGALDSLRLSGRVDDYKRRVEGLFGDDGLLTILTTGAWLRFVQNVLPRAGAGEEQAISQSVAGTVAAWVGMIGQAAQLGAVMRQVRPQDFRADVLERIIGTPAGGYEDGLLWQLAVAGWHFVSGAASGGQQLQGVSQQVAATFAAWGGVMEQMATLGRSLRLVVAVDERDWQRARQTLERVMQTAGDFSADFLRMDDPATTLGTIRQVGETIAAWVRSISDVAGLGRTLRDAIEPTDSEWEAAEAVVVRVFGRMRALAGRFVGGLDHTEAVGQEGVTTVLRQNLETLTDWQVEILPRIQAFMEALGSAVAAFGAAGGLTLYGAVLPNDAEIEAVELLMGRLVKTITAYGRAFGRTNPNEAVPVADAQEASARAEAFAGAVSSAVSSFGGVAGLMQSLSMMRVPDVPDSLLDSLEAGIRRVYTRFMDLFDALVPTGEGADDPARFLADLERRMAQADTFAGVAQQAIGTLAAVADLMVNMTGHAAKRLSGGEVDRLAEGARRMVTSLWTLFESLWAQPPDERDRAELERRWQQYASFLGVAQASLGSGSAAVDLLVKVSDSAGKLSYLSAGTQSIMRTAIRDMIALFGDLAAEFSYGTSEGARLMAQTAEFAQTVAAIVAPMATLAETLLTLDAFMWEVVEPTGDARRSAGSSSAGFYQRAKGAITDTGHGPTRRRRIVDVQRDRIREIIDTAMVVVDAWKTAWQEFSGELSGGMASAKTTGQQIGEGLSGLLSGVQLEVQDGVQGLLKEIQAADTAFDADDIMAAMGTFSDRVAQVVGNVGSMTEAILSILSSPLTALPYVENGKTGEKRWRSNFSLGVARRRADFTAEQIKESIKRSVKAIVDALAEVLNDPELGLPSADASARLREVMDTVHAIFAIIAEANEAPDPDLVKIEKLVEASRLLAQLQMPLGALGGAMGGGTGDSLVGAGGISRRGALRQLAGTVGLGNVGLGGGGLSLLRWADLEYFGGGGLVVDERRGQMQGGGGLVVDERRGQMQGGGVVDLLRQILGAIVDEKRGGIRGNVGVSGGLFNPLRWADLEYFGGEGGLVTDEKRGGIRGNVGVSQAGVVDLLQQILGAIVDEKRGGIRGNVGVSGGLFDPLRWADLEYFGGKGVGTSRWADLEYFGGGGGGAWPYGTNDIYNRRRPLTPGAPEPAEIVLEAHVEPPQVQVFVEVTREGEQTEIVKGGPVFSRVQTKHNKRRPGSSRSGGRSWYEQNRVGRP